ncbi:MAG: hypothetical protein ABIV28_07485 [Longimicrobiales bacterium]
MDKRILSVVMAAGLALTAAACDVDKTKDGEAPSITVDAGKLPEYDVQTPTVEVKKDTIVVPTVKVTPPPPDTTKI